MNPPPTPQTPAMLREAILDMVSQYFHQTNAASPFIPGETPIPYAKRNYSSLEMQSLVSAALDFWLTAGPYTAAFEQGLCDYVGVRHVLMTNSGSSANLLAVSALCSKDLGARRLLPGDEVITSACAFPTTVNPILQNGLVPVFVDLEVPQYNPSISAIEAAISSKTKAIILAHTLGNPFDIGSLLELAKQHNLWVIEDNCDALGSTYKSARTGSFGDLATLSFYPAHHITTGEGGAVLTNSKILAKVVASLRDWGRDCWCASGKDNTCRKRFSWKLGSLPDNYDHKYIYSRIGYNLKATDLQASIGVEQLKKLPQFVEKRRENFRLLHEGLSCCKALILPQAQQDSLPSWFGFPITLVQNAGFSRSQLIAHLEHSKIATRPLFSGNILKHPAYAGAPHRIAGTLAQADRVMHDTFWIGVHPGLETPILAYMIDSFRSFFQSARKS